MVALWKSILKPLSVLALIGAAAGSFFHYMKVGPIEHDSKDQGAGHG